VCLAVRVSEAVALLNSEQTESENASERIKYSGRELTQAILLHRMGKKCKQRFLQAHRRDSYISKSQRGCNTGERSFFVEQLERAIETEAESLILKHPLWMVSRS